jgi:excisionase family DNA binding protein
MRKSFAVGAILVATVQRIADVAHPERRTVLRCVANRGRLRAWRTPGRHVRFTRSDCLDFARSLGRRDLVERPSPQERADRIHAPADSQPAADYLGPTTVA